MVSYLDLAAFTEDQHPGTIHQPILVSKVRESRSKSCIMFMTNPQFFFKLPWPWKAVKEGITNKRNKNIETVGCLIHSLRKCLLLYLLWNKAPCWTLGGTDRYTKNMVAYNLVLCLQLGIIWKYQGRLRSREGEIA